MVPVPDEVRYLLNQRYSLFSLTDHYRLRWCPPAEGGSDKHGRVWVPIHNEINIQVGGVLRSLHGDEPKELPYYDNERPGISWFQNDPPGELPAIVVVEDNFSAMRAARYVHKAVALRGTTINLERLQEIYRNKRPDDTVCIALDKDAASKAAEHVANWGWFGQLKMLSLQSDIKNLVEFELKLKMNELKELCE